MNAIKYLFLAVISLNHAIHASDLNTPETVMANAQSDFLTQTEYFSPKEKLEFARRMPQTTDLERNLKSAAHLALRDDAEVQFYLKIQLDKALR